MGFFSRLFGCSKKQRQPDVLETIPSNWKEELHQHIPFYSRLTSEDKIQFEQRVLEFIRTTKITGIQTSVEKLDRLIIGASAIIPIFAFPKWKYHNLDEVLLFPKHFDEDFVIGSSKKIILGAVGNGILEGRMAISKQSLYHGFKNSTDKQNTAVHEFVHLMDKSDGTVDGVLDHFKPDNLSTPWIELMENKIEEIRKKKSDIRPYGATNRAEFLAVSSEYFFERPELLKKKHPVLYSYLELMFNQPLADKKLKKVVNKTVRHFDPCPCQSGKKYRSCCMS